MGAVWATLSSGTAASRMMAPATRNGVAPSVPVTDSSRGPSAKPPATAMLYSATTRPRAASSATWLIHASPHTHRQLPAAPMAKRRANHAGTLVNTGSSRKAVSDTRMAPSMITAGPVRLM